MKTKEKFSQKLEAAREKLRLTQPEMAELMGLKERQYIGKKRSYVTSGIWINEDLLL